MWATTWGQSSKILWALTQTRETCILCNIVFASLPRTVMVHKEMPNKFYLRPNNLCSHLLSLFCVFFNVLFFSDRLWHPSLHSQIFQISVCRGMCQFRTDDLVFTHALSYKHWKAPLHTLDVCEYSTEIHPFIWIQFTARDLSGCGKCQLWNWLIFNYRRLLCTQLLYSWLLFFSQHLIGAETAWPILFGENVYFICASSEGGLELNLQCLWWFFSKSNALQITHNLFNIASRKFINWIT